MKGVEFPVWISSFAPLLIFSLTVYVDARKRQYNERQKQEQNQIERRRFRGHSVIGLYSLLIFPLPILFALMLNEVRNLKLKKTVQMITYAPHFLSEVVVCSLVLMMLAQKIAELFELVKSLFGL